MNEKNKWWGYVHTNGSIQVKRYFDKRDIEEAYESPFCDIVIEPFYCDNREEAIEYVKNSI